MKRRGTHKDRTGRARLSEPRARASSARASSARASSARASSAPAPSAPAPSAAEPPAPASSAAEPPAPAPPTPAEPHAPEPRCQPRQTRGVETWNRILEAAARLFAEQTYEQTTTHQIAHQAGVSVGALYRYFESKECILKELYRREISGLRQRALDEFTMAELVSKDLSALLRKTLTMAFRLYSERPSLRRVLAEQSRKIGELVELRRSLEREVHQAVTQILRVAPGVRVPDPPVAAYLVALFIESLMDDHVLYGHAGAEMDDDRLITAASDLILRALMGRLE